MVEKLKLITWLFRTGCGSCRTRCWRRRRRTGWWCGRCRTGWCFCGRWTGFRRRCARGLGGGGCCTGRFRSRGGRHARRIRPVQWNGLVVIGRRKLLIGGSFAGSRMVLRLLALARSLTTAARRLMIHGSFSGARWLGSRTARLRNTATLQAYEALHADAGRLVHEHLLTGDMLTVTVARWFAARWRRHQHLIRGTLRYTKRGGGARNKRIRYKFGEIPTELRLLGIDCKTIYRVR